MKFLLVSLLALSSLSAFAKDCSDEVSTNAIFQCEAANLEAEDKRLNDLYKQASAKLDKIGQKKLQAAQRAWITFRDANCEVAADEMRGGTFEKVLRVSCHASETKDRADALQDIVEFR